MFGTRIKELRLENHFTQRQLAEKVSVDFRTVSFWETERYEPNISQIIKLCNVFHTTSDYLLGITNFY